MHSRRPVVLLVAEAVTLAHFARIAALAERLDSSAYDVVVATDPRYLDLGAPRTRIQRIRSISSAEFAAALAAGKPVYDIDTLAHYVEDDLQTIREVRPDLVVGDFRLSLAISAPLSHVRYAAVVNAYWSPYSKLPLPVPDLPFTRIVGLPLAQALFDAVRPAAFALHAGPLERLRRRHGLPSLGYDLRTVYSWGDFTLYADVPGYVPMDRLPSNHRHIGPPRWSAKLPLPAWWHEIPVEKPVVLVTLGSSGNAETMPVILDMLATRPITVVAATAGNPIASRTPSNAFMAGYLPLDRVVERASVVVCNGGSLTTYEALRAGVPVLGICTNMDQLLNMSAVEHLGAGIALRSGKLAVQSIGAALDELLTGRRHRDAAARASERIRASDGERNFERFVADVLPDRTGESPA